MTEAKFTREIRAESLLTAPLDVAAQQPGRSMSEPIAPGADVKPPAAGPPVEYITKDGRGVLREKHLNMIAKVVGVSIADAILLIREKEIAPLKARIAELEARPVIEDKGVWNETEFYRSGACVIHDGSSWVAREPNSKARPGHSACWRLLAKRGRDGKDARGSR